MFCFVAACGGGGGGGPTPPPVQLPPNAKTADKLCATETAQHLPTPNAAPATSGLTMLELHAAHSSPPIAKRMEWFCITTLAPRHPIWHMPQPQNMRI